jgi:DNA-binding CsgD family transcriptional regulator
MENKETTSYTGNESKKDSEKAFTGYLRIADPEKINRLEPGTTDENIIILHVPLDKLHFKEILRLTEGRKNGLRLILSELSDTIPETKQEITKNDNHNKVSINYNISDRKKEVLECLAEGMSYEDSSKFLNVSVNTIKRHVSDLFLILDVHNRTLAARKYITFIKTIFITCLLNLISEFTSEGTFLNI